MNNNLEFIKWLCKDSDVYKPTLICNCILFVVLGLAIYFVFNAYGCNFWFFVLSFIELSTLYSFYWLPKEAYERWKELELKKEKIEIEKQRCEYIKEKYPNAYSDYVNQCKGKRPLDSDIASITDKEWQAKENEIVVAPATEVVPEAPKAKPASKNITYKIKWGDTLWDLAKTYYNNPWKYPKIAKYNGIKNPDHIISGTTIVIPAE